jgi:hypothetical protein
MSRIVGRCQDETASAVTISPVKMALVWRRSGQLRRLDAGSRLGAYAPRGPWLSVLAFRRWAAASSGLLSVRTGRVLAFARSGDGLPRAETVLFGAERLIALRNPAARKPGAYCLQGTKSTMPDWHPMKAAMSRFTELSIPTRSVSRSMTFGMSYILPGMGSTFGKVGQSLEKNCAWLVIDVSLENKFRPVAARRSPFEVPFERLGAGPRGIFRGDSIEALGPACGIW